MTVTLSPKLRDLKVKNWQRNGVSQENKGKLITSLISVVLLFCCCCLLFYGIMALKWVEILKKNVSETLKHIFFKNNFRIL